MTAENSKEIWGWALYDFAHSAYHTTVTSVIFAVYFAEQVVGEQGVPFWGPGETVWAYAVSLSMFLTFLVSPILGSIADFSAAKKRFLLVFCYSGVFATALLFFVGRGDVWLGVTFFVLSNLLLEAGLSFYHAFLAEITTPDRMGRVSGFGWALGYVGSTLCLLLNLVMIERPSWFFLSESDDLHVRTAMLVVAAWWGVFAIPMFLWVRERALPQSLPAHATYLKIAVQRLRLTLKKVNNYRELLKFLIAYLIYNDGIQTVIVMAAIFGSKELGMERQELIPALLLNQSVAFAGALGFGYLADRLDSKKTIYITLAIWSASLVFAMLMDQKWQFWVLCVVIGLVLGGSQSASRALFAQFTPPANSAQFFAFFSVSGKFASVFGPVVFGLVSNFAGIRYGIGSILIFFVIGMFLLHPVDEKKGMEQARHAVA